MKHLIKILFFAMMIVLFPTTVTAQTSPAIGGTLKKWAETKDIPSKRQRTTLPADTYTISNEEGLHIMASSVSTDNIIEFEICEIGSNLCISSFVDELMTSDYELICDISI